jgi:hypothetical protein
MIGRRSLNFDRRKRNMKTISKVLIVGALLAFLLWACSKDSPQAPAQQTIEDVVKSGGEFEEFADREAVSEDSVFSEDIDNEVYYCTKRTHDITKGYDDFPLFDPNVTVVYPGNLLQGATLADATPSPIPVDRAGGTIVTTLMNGQDDSSKVAVYIGSVTLDSVMIAANRIVSGFGGSAMTARTTLRFQQVTTEHEFALALGANISSVNFDVNAEFGYKSSHKYNRMMVKLTQSYYTLAFVSPTKYSDVFASSVTADDLAPYIGPGNPAAFIESVTYGRIFYLLVQSTSSATDVNFQVEAFVRGAVSGGGSVEVEDLSSLEELDINGYALGGDAGQAAAALLGDFQAVRNFIESGGTYDTGVALSYVVRSLARPDKIVRVKVNTEYDEIICVPVGRSLEKPLFWYTADHPDIVPVNIGNVECVDTWYNLFEDPTMDAVPLEIGHYGGEFIPNALSSTEGPKPAIKCYRESGLLDGIFKYKEDNRFINTDYTVFAMVRLENAMTPYPTYFMFGTSSEPFKNLSIGFWSEDELVMSHRGQDIIAELPSSYLATDYNVYTFVFSKDDGMSVYIGFESDPIMHDPTATTPLTVYRQPRFGSSTGSAVSIVELMAYGIAANEAQRLAIVQQISDRYIW